MEWIELRTSKNIEVSSGENTTTENRTIEYIVDNDPETVRNSSETPEIGDKYSDAPNTITNSDKTLRAQGISIQREPDAEDEYSRVTITYNDDVTAHVLANWKENWEWTSDISYNTHKTNWGTTDQPPTDHIIKRFSHPIAPSSDFTKVGKEGEGAETAIPTITLNITRQEPKFPSKTLLDIAGSINSNNDWVFYGDKWMWKFEGAQAEQESWGVNVSYNFTYDIFKHKEIYFELAESKSGSKLYRPLNEHGEVIKNTKEVYFYSNGNQVDEDAVEDEMEDGNIEHSTLVPENSNVSYKYFHQAFVLPEADFNSFEFWSPSETLAYT